MVEMYHPPHSPIQIKSSRIEMTARSITVRESIPCSLGRFFHIYIYVPRVTKPPSWDVICRRTAVIVPSQEGTCQVTVLSTTGSLHADGLMEGYDATAWLRTFIVLSLIAVSSEVFRRSSFISRHHDLYTEGRRRRDGKGRERQKPRISFRFDSPHLTSFFLSPPTSSRKTPRISTLHVPCSTRAHTSERDSSDTGFCPSTRRCCRNTAAASRTWAAPRARRCRTVAARRGGPA